MAFGRKTMIMENVLGVGGHAPCPSFGYAVELRKALNIQRFNQNVAAFDRGAAFDSRRGSFKLLLNERNVNGEIGIDAIGVLFDKPYSAQRYTLRLPESSGFYPAGPDKGDSGDFIFSLTDNPEYSEMKTTPFNMFEAKISVMFHETPSPPTLPARKDFGGAFTFGSVEGIRDPKMSPVQEQSVARAVSIGAENYQVFSPTDEFLCNMTITASTGKMAEIADFIQSERGEGFNIKTGANYYPWGGQLYGAADAVNRVKMLEPNFIFTHVSPDLWTLPVQLWRRP